MEKEEENEREQALNRAYSEMSYGGYGGYYGGGNRTYGAGTQQPIHWFRGGAGYYPGYRW